MEARVTKPLRGDRCRCTACGEFFNSTSAFDKHRSGSYVSRRCLTADEMLSIGMERPEHGFWVGSRRPVLTLPSRVETAISSDPLSDKGVQA
jgi:hypothetical protein